MRKVEDLIVYQKSMTMVTEIYRITKQFPDDERFGLTSQLRRAAVSIPSNIAEGSGRNSEKEFSHFLSIARGSVYEVKTQLKIAEQLGYTNENAIETPVAVLNEIQKMLFSLIKKSTR